MLHKCLVYQYLGLLYPVLTCVFAITQFQPPTSHHYRSDFDKLYPPVILSYTPEGVLIAVWVHVNNTRVPYVFVE